VGRNGSTIEGDASDYSLAQPSKETTFVYYAGTWNAFESHRYAITDLAVPQLSGPTVGGEGSDVEIAILNYAGSTSYTVTTTGGSAVRTVDNIVWTLPNVSANTIHTISVEAVSGENSETNSFEVNVINIEVVSDAAIIITDFDVDAETRNWTEV